MSRRRNGLRKQVTETKEGLLEFRRKKWKGNGLGGGEGEGRSQGRISLDYSSAFQVCPFRVVVSTDWSMSGQGVISQCSWA